MTLIQKLVKYFPVTTVIPVNSQQ